MTWTQHIMTCQTAVTQGLDLGTTHNGQPASDCIAIICTDDATGAMAWHSHDVNTIDPATRINPSVPAKDYR